LGYVVLCKSTNVSKAHFASVFWVEKRAEQDTSAKGDGYESSTSVSPKCQLTFNGLQGITSLKNYLWLILLLYHISFCILHNFHPGLRLFNDFRNKLLFLWWRVVSPTPNPSWRTTPCRLSTAVYRIYSQLPSIAEGRSCIHNMSTRHAVVVT
jgi:hypothetical protein